MIYSYPMAREINRRGQELTSAYTQLKIATEVYKNNLKTTLSERNYHQTVLNILGEEIKMRIDVPALNIPEKHYQNIINSGGLFIFSPNKLKPSHLKQMNPFLKNLIFEDDTSFINKRHESEWKIFQPTVEAPYCGESLDKIKRKFNEDGVEGVTINDYILASEQVFRLYRRRLDLNSSICMLLGTTDESGNTLAVTPTNEFGSLRFETIDQPWENYPGVGARYIETV